MIPGALLLSDLCWTRRFSLFDVFIYFKFIQYIFTGDWGFLWVRLSRNEVGLLDKPIVDSGVGNASGIIFEVCNEIIGIAPLVIQPPRRISQNHRSNKGDNQTTYEASINQNSTPKQDDSEWNKPNHSRKKKCRTSAMINGSCYVWPQFSKLIL